MSLQETKDQAQRQLDYLLQLLQDNQAFTAPHIGVDPGLRHDVMRAGRKDVRSARRSYRGLDRYLNRTQDNPYKNIHVARAPGREGRQSAAAFANVAKLLAGDTRQANKSRLAESKMDRRDTVGEIRSGRDAFMTGLRMQAWQQQMQQQAMMNQARMQAIMQMAQLYGTAGGDMPDIASLFDSLMPTPPAPPGQHGDGNGPARPAHPLREGGPGRGRLPIGNGNNNNNNGPGSGGLASAGPGGGTLPIEGRGLVPPMNRQGFTDDFNVLPMPDGRAMPNFDQFVGAAGRPLAPWMFNKGQFEEVDRNGKPIPRPIRRRRGPGQGRMA